jgi:hypothetical protein
MQIIEELAPFYRDLIALGDALQGENEEIPTTLFNGLSAEQFAEFRDSTEVRLFDVGTIYSSE